MTSNQGFLLAPVWLQPSMPFLPLQPHFSHVTSGKCLWTQGSWVLTKHVALCK